MLKSAIGLFQQHDWTIAEYRVTTFRHVPRSALSRTLCYGMIGRCQRGNSKLRARQRQCQEKCRQNFHPTLPGSCYQIVFAILRPSTISAIPNGGFVGSDFRTLPATWLRCELPAGASWVIGAWVIGAWVIGA